MTSLDYAAMLRQAKAKKQKEITKPTFTLSPAPIYDDLEKYRVGPIPNIYYFKDYITDQDEKDLMQQIYAAPSSTWTQLPRRRLQNWGGVPNANGMVAETLPDWLAVLGARLRGSGFFKENPNQVLLNEYLPGQGIMPHRDGPFYESTAAAISLNSPAWLDFYMPTDNNEDQQPSTTPSYTNDTKMDSEFYKHKKKVFSCFLEPKSLIVFSGEAYDTAYHGIASTPSANEAELLPGKDSGLPGNSAGEKNSVRLSITMRIAKNIIGHRDDLASGVAKDDFKRMQANWFKNVSEPF